MRKIRCVISARSWNDMIGVRWPQPSGYARRLWSAAYLQCRESCLIKQAARNKEVSAYTRQRLFDPAYWQNQGACYNPAREVLLHFRFQCEPVD